MDGGVKKALRIAFISFEDIWFPPPPEIFM